MKAKKIIRVSVLLPLMAVAALALPGMASAETGNHARNDWVNSSVVVWKNPFGQCWQGRHWMPAMSGEDCAGDAPTSQPAMLMVQPGSERHTLAMNTVAESAGDSMASSFDSSAPPEPSRTMITSCFTTHN